MVATRAFSASQVRTVAPGMILVGPVARQMQALILLGAIDGRRLTPAGRFGAGWRDLRTQRLFFDASRGNLAAIGTLHALGTTIDPHLHVSVAMPGTSSHGDSTRVDVLFNGRNATGADIAWMASHNWDHEFGAADQNHFRWTGTMSGAVATRTRNRVVAHFLNTRHLGRSTAADQDGDWPERSNMGWLLQTLGHEDGLYPTPKYTIDGIRGPRTTWLRDHYFEQLIG